MNKEEMEAWDLNGNGKIDPDERELLLDSKKREIEDMDHKRDAQLKMTWFALSGLILYPLGIVAASITGFNAAAGLIADIANIYIVSVSALVGAYFGFTNMGNRK
tara:strand:- start:229 stop:543 length:315 start_codon:yes stop_codon:yes gene_type:complete